MSIENNGNGNELINRDLWKVSLHQFTIRGTDNYRRQQNAGLIEAMISVTEKYYKDPEEEKETCVRHMEYFLANDVTSAIPVGVAAAMEERYATEGDTDPGSVNAVKTALIEPLTGLGDSLLSGTAKPILAGTTISLITAGPDQVGPIFFAIGTSIVLLGVGYLGVFQGYKQGVKFMEEIRSSGLIGRISELAAIVAYVIVGGLIPALVVISTPAVYQNDDTALSIQETLDGLMSGILGMLYTGLMYPLISEKKIFAVKLILVAVTVDIVGTYCSILG